MGSDSLPTAHRLLPTTDSFPPDFRLHLRYHEPMSRPWLSVASVLAIVTLVWFLADRADHLPPPSRPELAPASDEPTHPLLAGLEGPFPELASEPAKEGAPQGKTPVEPPNAERERLLELAGAAMQQAGVLMRETLDIDSYLHGGGTIHGEKFEVPPDVVGKLFEILETAPPDQKLKVAVAMAMVKLRPEEIDLLTSRLEAELAGMRDEATKNVVLGLTYALAAQGDSRGTARLSDALRTGEGSEIPNFRNGAVLILAIAEDEATAPLLRELLAADPDRLVRKHSAIGLGKLGGEENAEALAIAVSQEEDIEVRAWSALARGRSSSADEGVGDAVLFQALKEDPDGEVRAAAAYAYAATGGPEVLDTLVGTWYGEDHEFARIGLAAGVARREDRAQAEDFLKSEAGPFLTESVTGSERSLVRFYSATTLGMLPATPEGSAALRRTVSGDRSEWVRIGAVDALVTSEGKAAKEFFAAELTKENSERMTRKLEDALRRIGGE